MRFLYILAAILVASSSSHEIEKRQAKSSKDSAEKRVVCYYTNWSVYRKGLAKYTPKNINPYLCTHLVYAFGGLTDEFEVTTFDSYQDIEQGGYAQFNGLKQYNKHMKTLLALGGWNEGSARFSELVAYKDYRENFTLSAIKHLRRYNFDGLDLDWEYPGSRDGSMPEDKENYATLVMELREAFEMEASKSSKPRLLLTMAIPAGQKYIDKGYNVPKLNKYLDFFNLLTYDYHSIYEPSVNHHAALFPPPGISEYEVNYQLNVDWTIRYYLKKGASMNKLVVGIPTYGRSYTLLDPDFFTMGSSADGPGNKGNYTNEKGYLAFYEVCEAISLDGWEVRKPYPKRVGPFAFKGNQWVGYDDEKIVVRKAEYVRDNGLGGIMFWTLDSDDFRGLCNGEEYPLIEAAKAALYQPSLTDQNEAKSLGQSRLDSSSKNTISNKLSVRGRRPQQKERPTTTTKAPSRRRPGRRRPGSQSAVSIDPFNTPEPPTTPSSVKAFDCKREGFYPNPDDCKKYYWCLSSGASGLGIVAHSFTCPSDLIFSKQIDGCDHPTRAKCKIGGRSRGRSKGTPSTTAIPTTTEFEYLIEDFDYYYDYDFVDKPLKPLEEVTQIENILEKDISQPVRNAGGSQFQGITETEPEKLAPPEPDVLQRTPDQGRTRNRPQYSSVQRDRSKSRQESNVEEPVAEEKPAIVESKSHSLRPQRPQYVTLNRQRPTSGVAATADDQYVEEYQDVVEHTPESVDGLTYVTLHRSRHPSTEPSVFEVSDATTTGLEYVTLRRSRPSTTEDPFLDYLYYTDEELAQDFTTTTAPTTTTTTTTTTAKPRIRLPTRLRGSRPRPSPRPRQSVRKRPTPQPVQKTDENTQNTGTRRRFRGRTTPTPEEPIVEEEVDRFTRFRGRVTPKPVQANEQEKVERPTRFRGRLTPRPVQPNQQEENDELTRVKDTPAPEPDLLKEEAVITELPTEPPQVTTSPEPSEPVTSVLEKSLDELLEKPVEEVLDLLEPTEGPDGTKIRPVEVTTEPTEQPNEEVTKPAEPAEPTKPAEPAKPTEPELSSAKSQAGDSLIEETLLLFRQNKQEAVTPSERASRIRTFQGQRKQFPSLRKVETSTEVNKLPETTTIPVESPKPPVRTRPRTRIPPRPRPALPTRIPPRPRERPLSPTRPRPRPRPGLRPHVVTEESIVEVEKTPKIIPEVPESERALEKVSKSKVESSVTSPFSFFDILPTAKPSSDETTSKTTTTTTTTTTATATQKPSRSPPTFRLRHTSKRPHEISTTKAPEDSDSTPSAKLLFPLNPATTTTQETKTTPKLVFFDFLDTSTSKPETTTKTVRVPGTRRLKPRPVVEFTSDTQPSITKPPRRPSATTTRRPKLPLSTRTSRPRTFVTSSSPLFPVDYDFVYDYDPNAGVLGSSLAELADLTDKAHLHANGTIECFDTGYFPHPYSCKKFISCSKTVRGFLRGWIYTCPQELVFDPVGGMCNWTEDVDCSKDIRA